MSEERISGECVCDEREREKREMPMTRQDGSPYKGVQRIAEGRRRTGEKKPAPRRRAMRRAALTIQ